MTGLTVISNMESGMVTALKVWMIKIPWSLMKVLRSKEEIKAEKREIHREASEAFKQELYPILYVNSCAKEKSSKAPRRLLCWERRSWVLLRPLPFPKKSFFLHQSRVEPTATLMLLILPLTSLRPTWRRQCLAVSRTGVERQIEIFSASLAVHTGQPLCLLSTLRVDLPLHQVLHRLASLVLPCLAPTLPHLQIRNLHLHPPHPSLDLQQSRPTAMHPCRQQGREADQGKILLILWPMCLPKSDKSFIKCNKYFFYSICISLQSSFYYPLLSMNSLHLSDLQTHKFPSTWEELIPPESYVRTFIRRNKLVLRRTMPLTLARAVLTVVDLIKMVWWSLQRICFKSWLCRAF